MIKKITFQNVNYGNFKHLLELMTCPNKCLKFESALLIADINPHNKPSNVAKPKLGTFVHSGDIFII